MGKMNRVTISVPQDVDLTFRKKAAIKFAFRRGWYGRAVIEAMKLWITAQTARTESISDEKKEHLWNTFKDSMNITTTDPNQILDYIVKFFTTEVKIANKIDYELNDGNVVITKKGSLEPLLSQLITEKDECIIFNCPVEIIADAALKDLTGEKYTIKSDAHTLISAEALKE